MKHNKRASTLVEIVIYFTLLAAFLSVATIFSIQIIGASHSVSNESDLATELSLIREIFGNDLLEASSVNEAESSLNDPNGVLSLQFADLSKNPTVYSLSAGKLQVQYGSDSPQVLNSDQVTFESLTFQLYTNEKTPDHVIVDALVSVNTDLDTSGASQNFHLALSLRP